MRLFTSQNRTAGAPPPPPPLTSEVVYTYSRQNNFTTTNDFYTSNGVTKSIVSGRMKFETEGVSTQYATVNEQPEHCYERTYDEFIWRVVTAPSSSATGWRMQYGSSFKTKVGFNTNTRKIEVLDSAGTLHQSTSTLPSVSVSDRISMVIERINLTLSITVTNLTTSQGISWDGFAYSIQVVSPRPVVPDTYRRELHWKANSSGEIVEFEDFRLGLKKYTTVKVLCVGDSITAGYTCDEAINRWSQKLKANFASETAGGPGDGTARCLTSTQTLIDLINPQYVLVGIGVNDASIPQSTYSSLVSTIVSSGSVPILFLMANDARDQTFDWTWIQDTYPSYVMVEPWNATLKSASTTGQMNTLYTVSGENNHYNAAGNTAIYNAILASGKIV